MRTNPDIVSPIVPVVNSRLKSYGIVGKFDIGPGYVIAITGRELVATIYDKEIYCISNIAVIPLTYELAKPVILESIEQMKKCQDMTDETQTESEMEVDEEELESEDEDTDVSSIPIDSDASSTIVEDVYLKKPPSRFFRSWFTRTPPNDNINGATIVDRNTPFVNSLILRLVKCITSMFTSKSFYFSYDLDITGSLLTNAQNNSNGRKAFQYNQFLISTFPSPLALSVIQGFIRSIDITLKGNLLDSEQIEKGQVILVSRRSTKRAGVRYLRRGIDDSGSCANFVETEQLLVCGPRVLSFTQIRGSMPIFFSQSPYKLTPTPKLKRSKEDTLPAFQEHFENLMQSYQNVMAISLVEKSPSRESAIGEMYQDLCVENGVTFEWFDFHGVCKGMKFENVETLADTPVGPRLQGFGWSDSNGKKRQSGVFRINCIDCLDRTNVVESWCAKTVLQLQLKEFDMVITSTDFESRLRGMWADNGDAISLQYSNTNALKGDFTRTKKRNYKGVLTDAFLTLSRYYYGMVTDFFTQTVLDYILGNVDESVFEEFEHYLQSSDPAMNMDSIRQNAVEIASGIVIGSDDETFIGGWWLLTPKRQDALRKVELDECILLVTTDAIYVCQFDLRSEKVIDFRRVSAVSVTEIQTGVYFNEILSDVSKDPARNIGILIKSSEGIIKASEDKTKKAKYKIQPATITTTTTDQNQKSKPDNSSKESFVAFKIPLLKSNEKDEILTALVKTCKNAIKTEQDIVSLDQAKSDTRFWDLLEFQMKKVVWGP